MSEFNELYGGSRVTFQCSRPACAPQTRPITHFYYGVAQSMLLLGSFGLFSPYFIESRIEKFSVYLSNAMRTYYPTVGRIRKVNEKFIADNIIQTFSI